jgi:hypothetical protein
MQIFWPLRPASSTQRPPGRQSLGLPQTRVHAPTVEQKYPGGEPGQQDPPPTGQTWYIFAVSLQLLSHAPPLLTHSGLEGSHCSLAGSNLPSRQGLHFPSRSHFPSEQGEPKGLVPGTQALLRHVEVEHSPPVAVHSVIVIVIPSALQATTASPWHDFAPGMQTLQRPADALHNPAPHGSLFAKSEPSALQVSSVPDASQVLALGIQTISVHAPASALHSASDAHVMWSIQSPASEQTLSLAPSH